MDFINLLGGAIVLGSTIGTTVAGFFAYRQKSLVTLLRESNKDYKDRVDQLESERDELNKRIDTLTAAVKQLQQQKALPLENLTALIIKQNEHVIQEMSKIAQSIADMPNGKINPAKTATRRKK